MLRRSGQVGSSFSADAGTAMGGRMCVGRSVFAVRLRTPSPTLLRTSCRWRSGATPVTMVPPSLANRMLSLLIWEHGVKGCHIYCNGHTDICNLILSSHEGGQAVTTKDRARGGAKKPSPKGRSTNESVTERMTFIKRAIKLHIELSKVSRTSFARTILYS